MSPKLFLAGFLSAFTVFNPVAASPAVTLGVDVLLEPGSPHLALVAGKRIGLVTNQSGVDGNQVPTVDRLARDPRVTLVRLFGPEHGIRGEVPAGEKVDDGRDPETGIPVVSLYGKDRKPSRSALEGVDLLMFDIQDVGSRTYTYISTLGEVMRACAETGIPLMVLDRPNPLSGAYFEGPMIEDRFRSFIGWGPVPVLHGLTLGEAARYFNDQLNIGCTLHVVPMRGWKRAMVWDDTGLFWTITSPHIPSVTQAYLYATTGMVSATLQGVNEGIGSTMPFEVIGAEFINAPELQRALQALNLPGVRFQAISYKPFYGSYRDKPLRGVRLTLTSPRAYRPIRTSMAILTTLRRLYPDKFQTKEEMPVGRHWGTAEILGQLRSGVEADTIIESWRSGNENFATARQRALIYE